MLCLGIESSCDETALALVEDGQLRGSALASQAELHALFGGVVPELASREHYHYIGALFDDLSKRANINSNDIDVVAVARGPGLLGSLLVGVAFAKGLALALDKPFLGVNHLHAHLLANGLTQKLEYPVLGLLVSGGHTELCRIESPWKIERLGRTLDDAAGEVFDKTAKILGFPYPGGTLVDEHAKRGKANPHLLPSPFLNNANLDFSFSGLKTAAVNVVNSARKRNGKLDESEVADFCASFNFAVVHTLVKKVDRALRQNRDVKQLWLAGGVAANSLLRAELQKLAKKRRLDFRAPDLAFCCDNGAMIAYAGWLLAKHGFSHDLDMEAIPRGRNIPDDMRREC